MDFLYATWKQTYVLYAVRILLYVYPVSRRAAAGSAEGAVREIVWSSQRRRNH